MRRSIPSDPRPALWLAALLEGSRFDRSQFDGGEVQVEQERLGPSTLHTEAGDNLGWLDSWGLPSWWSHWHHWSPDRGGLLCEPNLGEIFTDDLLRDQLGGDVQFGLLLLLLLLGALVARAVLLLLLPEKPVAAPTWEHPVDQLVAAVMPQVLQILGETGSSMF